MYDVFISYSHRCDQGVAAAVQKQLQRIGKPWYRLRSLRVFRDQTDLALNPDLWKTIENALNNSEFFLLFASANAAASPWVAREIELWLRLGKAEKLLIVLTSGSIAWDHSAQDFDWSATTALPVQLRGTFRAAPLWADLREAVGKGQLSRANPQFLESVARVAAAIRGIEVNHLISLDYREHRRTLLTAWAGIAVLACTTALASLFYYRSNEARNQAEKAGIAEKDARIKAERSAKLAYRQFDVVRSIVDLQSKGTNSDGALSAQTPLVEAVRQLAKLDDVNLEYEAGSLLVASILSNLGSELFSAQQNDESLRAYTEAINIFRELLESENNNTKMKSDLALALCGRARALQRLNRPQQAYRDRGEAADLAKALRALYPYHGEYGLIQAVCNVSMGWRAALDNDYAAGKRHFSEAATVLKELLTGSHAEDAKRELGGMAVGMMMLLRAQGKDEEAFSVAREFENYIELAANSDSGYSEPAKTALRVMKGVNHAKTTANQSK